MSMTPYIATVQTFEIEKLFDLCKLKSLYSSSGQSNDSGVTQEKSLAITDNERDFFNIVLKQAASNVYDVVSQDTKISQVPFQYNVDGKIIYSLMVHGDWDRNQAFGLNTSIESALIELILKESYKLRGNANLFSAAEANYSLSIATVKNLLNHRITPAKKVYRYV